jgi:capsule polysaccharide export protein KpsE/RkpR
VDNGDYGILTTASETPALPAVTPEQSDGDSGGEKWVDHARVLWAGRRLLARTAAVGLVAGVAVALLIPTLYQSRVRIMPPDSQNGAATLLAAISGNKNIPGGLTQLAGNLFGLRNTGALFTDLLGSRTVQDHLIDKFNLQKVYWKRYRRDARKKLAARTDVSEDRKSGVITLAVEDHDRQRAQQMAQDYVDQLNHLVASVNTSSARRERIFIEQRLTTVKQDLEDAERQLADFSSKNATLDVNQQTKAAVESAAMLQGQLIAAKSQLESLQQIYSDNNIRVRSLRAQIDELQRQLQKMSGTSSTVEALPLGAQDNNAIYPPLRQIPLLGARWLDLYRRARIQEQVYELLTQQYELARIEEAKSIPIVRVIDPPDFPEKKAFPPRALITLGAIILALVCASLWLIGQEKWRLTEDTDPRKLLVSEVRNSIAQARAARQRAKFREAA